MCEAIGICQTSTEKSLFESLNCGLMTHTSNIDLAITWANVDLSSVRSSDIHSRAILQEKPHTSIDQNSL